MAIAFAQTPVFNQQTTASTTVASGALSSAPTARNALLLVCYSVGNVTMTTPTGWQLLYSKSSTAGSMYMFTKEARSGDPTSFSTTQSAANAYECVLYELSGAASFILYNDASANGITTASTGWSTPSRTPLFTGVLPLAVLCSPSTTSPGWSAASGWTQDYNNTSGISMFAAHGNLTPDYSTPVSMSDIISSGVTGLSAIIMIAPAPIGAHVKQYSNTKTNTSTHTSSGALPLGALNGRMLVAFLTVASSGSNVTFTPPTGWTAGPSISDANNGIFTYYHQMASGDPTTYQWTVNTSASVGVDVALFEIEGADLTNPFQANVATAQPGANAIGFSLTVTPIAPAFAWLTMTDSHSDGLNNPSGWTASGFNNGSVAGSSVTEFFNQQFMHGAAWTTTSQSQSWTLTGSTDPQVLLTMLQNVMSSGSVTATPSPAGHQQLTKATANATLSVSASGKQTKVLVAANATLSVSKNGAQTVANAGKKSLTVAPSGSQTAQRIGNATLSATARGTQDPLNKGSVSVFPTATDTHVAQNTRNVALSLARIGKQVPANQGHVSLSLTNNAGFQTKPSQGGKILTLAASGHQIDATGAVASAYASPQGKQTIAKATVDVAVSVTRKGAQTVANHGGAVLSASASGSRVKADISSGQAQLFITPAGTQGVTWVNRVTLTHSANGGQTFTEVGNAKPSVQIAGAQGVANHGNAAVGVSYFAVTQLHVQRSGSVALTATTTAVQSSMNGGHVVLVPAAARTQLGKQQGRASIISQPAGRQAGSDSHAVRLAATGSGSTRVLSGGNATLSLSAASQQRYRKISNGAVVLSVIVNGATQVPTRGGAMLSVTAAGRVRPIITGSKRLVATAFGAQTISVLKGANRYPRASGSQQLSNTRDVALVITLREIIASHAQRSGGSAIALNSGGTQRLLQGGDVGLALRESSQQSHQALGYTFLAPTYSGSQTSHSAGGAAVALRGGAKVIPNGVTLSLKAVVVRVVTGTAQVQ